IKECLEELKLNPKIFNPRAVESRIDAAKNELIEPADYPVDDFFNEQVARVYELYAKKLKANNAVDFGDLLLLPVKLFEGHPEVLRAYRDRLHYLMVDEYQDTNRAQYRLIQLLAGERQNLCVVGDDDQSIYRWRGADVRNILDFEKDFPEATVIKLEQNYRSTKNILRAAGEVVRHIAHRKDKALWTENEAGERIVYYTGRTDKEEAAFVVQQIQRLRGAGDLRLADFAVFYRTNAQSRVFEDELRRQNIPYVIYGGTRFYDRMEIKDILSYLWVLANPADGLHLRRIINVPGRGIGKVTVEKLEQFAAQRGLSFFDALPLAGEAGVTGTTAKKILAFHQLLLNLQVLMKGERLSHFVQTLIERSGYLEELRAEDTLEAEGRIENLEELVNVVADYEAGTTEPSLQGFLDQVSLVSDIDKLDDKSQALPLMTLHLAKGLEFDVVFFVGMEEG
ncbi:AAA family ATPase, partial [bacterium]